MTFHLQSEVACVRTQAVVINTLSFGPGFNQTNGSIYGANVIDTSVSQTIHNTIIRGISQDPLQPSLIEFHLSTMAGHCGLLEIRLVQQRIFYFQRVTMMLLSYIRDHVVAALFCRAVYSTENERVLAWEKQMKAQQTSILTANLGMFRCSVVFHDTELHLPIHSKGADALVVVAKSMYLFKTCPRVHATDITGRYLSTNSVLAHY